MPAKISYRRTGTADSHCRSGDLCSGRTSDGPAITSKPDTICAACVQAIQKCLEELPHLAVALRAFLGVTHKTALQSRVKSTPEPACPLDPRVDALLGDIGDVIDRTDRLRVADLIHQPAMKFMVWIKGRPEMAYLDGCDRALAIRRIHSRANSVIGFEPTWQRRIAPCPKCGESKLGNWVGDDTVQCSVEDCGTVMSLDEYDAYCVKLIQ